MDGIDIATRAPARTIVLDLPAPPSVNKTRKVDWEGNRNATQWRDRADPLVLWSRSVRKGQPIRIIGRFELHITISEKRMDLDNGVKAIIDYLRRIGAIEDDSPKFLRKLTVEFGDAPEGCRVVVRAFA